MKAKIKLTNHVTGQTVTGEKEIPSKDHLQAQIKYPARIFENKKYKKPKHKKKAILDEISG